MNNAKRDALNQIYEALLTGERLAHLRINNLLMQSGVPMDEVDEVMKAQLLRESEEDRQKSRKR
jgi:hypothetical protein